MFGTKKKEGFDSNGKDYLYRGCVVYSTTSASFEIWNKPDDEFYGSGGGFNLGHVLAGESLEIIGNIYENIELLEVKEV